MYIPSNKRRKTNHIDIFYCVHFLAQSHHITRMHVIDTNRFSSVERDDIGLGQHFNGLMKLPLLILKLWFHWRWIGDDSTAFDRSDDDHQLSREHADVLKKCCSIVEITEEQGIVTFGH